jgi:hypothetical protein
MMPCDVSTHWNSTYNMLHFTLDFQIAIDSMTAMCNLDLQKYELSPAEWGIVKELRDVLNVCLFLILYFMFLNDLSQIFKDVTLFFSCGTPNLSTVIPAMDHINKVLATTSESCQFSLSIHAALIIGKNTVNCYYNKTDCLETYCIAMSRYLCLCIFSFNSFTSLLPVLHPQHKLAYFKTQGWEESWVNTAYNIVHEEYDHLYALPHLNNSSDGDDNYIAVCSVDLVCDFSP